MIYTHLAALLLGAAVAGVGAWKVQGWRFDAAEKERLEAAAELRRMQSSHVDTAAVGYERDKREIQTRFVTITEEVERVVEKPVYRDVCLDDDGLRLLRDAIGAADSAGEPAGAVPRPAASSGR